MTTARHNFSYVFETWFHAEIEPIARQFTHSALISGGGCDTNDQSIYMIAVLIREITGARDVVIKRTANRLWYSYIQTYAFILDVDDKFAVSVVVSGESVNVEFYAHDREWAAEKAAAVLDAIPDRKSDPDPHIVRFNFWYADGNGVQHNTKDINCPLPSEIQCNYSQIARDGLKFLTDIEDPTKNGKIILFHGPPGTGKTTAIRALAQEWATRLDATAEVFLDPEALMASSSYMNTIILDPSSRVVKKSGETTSGGSIRLIILEDCADIFAINCRDRPGFSRFLNVTDGIIGQGLKTVFLLSANEELGQIDPAVLRAGRCIKAVEFGNLSAEEGTDWLKKNGVAAANLEDEVSLADLYAIKNGITSVVTTEAPSKVGF